MEPGERAGRVVFLNGVPNAGKTSLAEAVQAASEEPYWHLSLDDFLRGHTERHRAQAGLSVFFPVMHGYLRALREMALCGNNIVAEAVITPNRLATYLGLFGDLSVVLAGLHVPLEEVWRRELTRTDRTHYHVTARDLEEVHAHGRYDLELDMMRLTPEEAAQEFLDLISSPPSPTAFERLMAEERS